MKARIKASSEVCDVLSIFIDRENGRYGFFALNEVEILPDEPEKLTPDQIKNDDILANDGMSVGHPLGNYTNPVDRERDK